MDLGILCLRIFFRINRATTVPYVPLRQRLEYHSLTVLNMLGFEHLQLLVLRLVVIDLCFHIADRVF